MPTPQLPVTRLSPHVHQISVPTSTLPPAVATNTYVICKDGEGVLVDAGTSEEASLEALRSILADLGVRRVVALIATHHHRDHTAGLPALHRTLDANVLMHPLDQARLSWSPEDRAALAPPPPALHVAGVTLFIRHHPGHTPGHVHVEIPDEGVILVGDHLAGEGSVWIGPPDGHMASYYRALDAIADSPCRIAGPGHGPALMDAAAAARALKARRQGREREILAHLARRPGTVEDLARALYEGTIPEGARTAAVRTVEGHLQHLVELGQVERIDSDNATVYRLVTGPVHPQGPAPTGS
ncbi:MBL fold metallo-hydrolase [Alicyclobacillus sp.]|uniref:MBL fold metallo-hydrolase n=1 Tax=Alicyclobacillus sp. TaxID=61169 RepID=UPI0025BE592F|nr:MBL fold metallo-hydrolase [Alicyclobacillus sp.]MCL6516640.1 MBL fold metallo-hydrolase [Alicyclobacillus sp.]